MNRIDRDALERALAACRAQDAGRAWQIDSKLASEPWEDVAAFAAYSAQNRSLRLPPWQGPPCHACLADLETSCSATRAAHARARNCCAVCWTQVCRDTSPTRSARSNRPGKSAMPLSLSDDELAVVMDCARPLPPRDRD
jgi:hypothetical protein